MVAHVIPSARLPEGGEELFELPGPEGRVIQAFCVRYGGKAYAWLNVCPHWGIGLDMDNGRFWVPGGQHLECLNHGALFRPDDGYCESGPCFGGRLTPVELDELDGEIRIYGPPRPTAAP